MKYSLLNQTETMEKHAILCNFMEKKSFLQKLLNAIYIPSLAVRLVVWWFPVGAL